MADREKVLAGLKCCLEDHDCILCPYDDVDSPFDECTHALFLDAMELLEPPEEVTGDD